MTASDSGTSPKLADGIRTALGIGGLIALVLGLLIMFFPEKSGAVAMQFVAIAMAAYALVVGAVYLGSAVFGTSRQGWARTGHILLGLLYVVGGIVVFANLGAAAAVLAVFLSVTIGMLWLFEGVMSISLVKQTTRKGWTIFYGLVSLVAGIVLIASPILGAVTLWLLLGISMVVLGLVQVVRAFSLRRE
ncbi:HdeD family acid-resistance protein [Leucobacter sp. GX24907]